MYLFYSVIFSGDCEKIKSICRYFFHEAAKKGDLKFLKFLHNNGAEINVKNSKGQTPILTAALHGHRLIVKYLYHHGTGFQGKTTTKMTQKIREMTAPMQIMQRMSEDYPM